MLVAVLELTDFAIIAAIVAVLAGGTVVARATFGAGLAEAKRAVEEYIDSRR